MDGENYLLLEKDDTPKELKLVIPSTALAEISKCEHTINISYGCSTSAHAHIHTHTHAHAHAHTNTIHMYNIHMYTYLCVQINVLNCTLTCISGCKEKFAEGSIPVLDARDIEIVTDIEEELVCHAEILDISESLDKSDKEMEQALKEDWTVIRIEGYSESFGTLHFASSDEGEQ